MITVPTVHLNGTSRAALLHGYTEAIAKIDEAVTAVRAAAPHGRDYYPQGEDAGITAMREHTARVRKLLDVSAELTIIAESLV